MSGHTPGPWSAVQRGRIEEPHGLSVAYCSSGTVVVFSGAYTISEREADANARLIAAAPDLLAAARHAIEFLDDLEVSDNSATQPTNTQAASFHMALASLRAAIAKAEGK